MINTIFLLACIIVGILGFLTNYPPMIVNILIKGVSLFVAVYAILKLAGVAK